MLQQFQDTSKTQSMQYNYAARQVKYKFELEKGDTDWCVFVYAIDADVKEENKLMRIKGRESEEYNDGKPYSVFDLQIRAENNSAEKGTGMEREVVEYIYKNKLIPNKIQIRYVLTGPAVLKMQMATLAKTFGKGDTLNQAKNAEVKRKESTLTKGKKLNRFDESILIEHMFQLESLIEAKVQEPNLQLKIDGTGYQNRVHQELTELISFNHPVTNKAVLRIATEAQKILAENENDLLGVLAFCSVYRKDIYSLMLLGYKPTLLSPRGVTVKIIMSNEIFKRLMGIGFINKLRKVL